MFSNNSVLFSYWLVFRVWFSNMVVSRIVVSGLIRVVMVSVVGVRCVVF